VVVQRSLGDPSCSQNCVQAGALEARSVDLAECRLQQAVARALRIAQPSSLCVSDSRALSTYQPVCMLIPSGITNQAVRAFGPVLRRYLSQNPCFGRFLGQLSRSDALHEFSNHVRLLTALVRSSPISRRPWSVGKPMRPMVIRMLLQRSCACGESSIFEV
jgi:hypothetical protein